MTATNAVKRLGGSPSSSGQPSAGKAELEPGSGTAQGAGGKAPALNGDNPPSKRDFDGVTAVTGGGTSHGEEREVL